MPSCRSCLLRLGAIALLCAAALPARAGQSNKWRLQFSGAAESAGELVLEIVPAGKTPVRVSVAIERNDGENRVARKVKTAIDRQAGRWVDAELDDGEDVLVKRHFFRRFSIALVSSTVKDVRINFDHE
jgi:phage tail sheath gpL-like